MLQTRIFLSSPWIFFYQEGKVGEKGKWRQYSQHLTCLGIFGVLELWLQHESMKATAPNIVPVLVFQWTVHRSLRTPAGPGWQWAEPHLGPVPGGWHGLLPWWVWSPLCPAFVPCFSLHCPSGCWHIKSIWQLCFPHDWVNCLCWWIRTGVETESQTSSNKQTGLGNLPGDSRADGARGLSVWQEELAFFAFQTILRWLHYTHVLA